MKRLLAALVLATSGGAALAQSGLGMQAESWSIPRWQARVGVNAVDAGGTAWQQQAGVVLGDYYFSRTRLGEGNVSGGFRATSGLLLGQRSMALGTPALGSTQSMNLTVLRQLRWAVPGLEANLEPWSAVPYVGLGWSGGSRRGGWGVSADLGLAARGTGLRSNPNQAVDDLLRELRLTPVVQLGVSYAF